MAISNYNYLYQTDIKGPSDHDFSTNTGLTTPFRDDRPSAMTLKSVTILAVILLVFASAGRTASLDLHLPNAGRDLYVGKPFNVGLRSFVSFPRRPS